MDLLIDFCKVVGTKTNYLTMGRIYIAVLIFGFIGFISCKEEKKATQLSAQELVDKSIVASGGELYNTSSFSFEFRNRTYVLDRSTGSKVLKRIQKNDTLDIIDIKTSNSFERYIDGEQVKVADSLAIAYGNSVNSVHYFAYLPYGLNDPAVKKENLGEIVIKGTKYHKVKVTFCQENGGDDFDDVYIYWFNESTNKPDYLAYEFHVNDGGLRFREAYNERIIKGVRFVDYYNYKPKSENHSIYRIDNLFLKNELELLSKIELRNITVNQGSYN